MSTDNPKKIIQAGKVTTTTRLNIRTEPTRSATVINVVNSDLQLAYDGYTLEGENISGNGMWYFTHEGSWFWSGAVKENHFSAQVNEGWWFSRLQIEKIWNDYDEHGENATVAVLDTGYDYSNTDLVVADSKKFIDYADSTNDILGHGTHCASLIGARNKKDWRIGVAPQCSLLVGKISNVGELKDFDAVKSGLQWAIDNGADIISISFGIPVADQNLQKSLSSVISQALSNAKKEPLVVAAIGNNTESTMPVQGGDYPALVPACISVGATDKTDKMDLVTLRNSNTTIFCPGSAIQSYWLNNVVMSLTGTSQATAIVAGVLALVVTQLKKSRNPSWKVKDIRNGIVKYGTPLADNSGARILSPIDILNNLT